MTALLRRSTASLERSLSEIVVLPLRLHLAEIDRGVQATMLRSVWGKALHTLSLPAYDAVFRADRPEQSADGRIPPSRPQPFVLSCGEPTALGEATVLLTLVGPAIRYEAHLLRAWQLAARYGVGPCRRPFRVVGCDVLQPDGRPVLGRSSAPWPLCDTAWPIDAAPESTPCRLDFVTPLRLVTRDRNADGVDFSAKDRPQLIRRPNFAQVIAAAIRRIAPFAASSTQSEWREREAEWATSAARHPAGPFRGEWRPVYRWSATQQARLNLSGVCGTLLLPAGPGPFWELLAAIGWLHVGKNTTHGLGAVWISRARNRALRARNTAQESLPSRRL